MVATTGAMKLDPDRGPSLGRKNRWEMTIGRQEE